jgi:hypothetical protein
MKTETFSGATREEAEAKVKLWRADHLGIVEKVYLLSEDGSPAGRFAPKSAGENKTITISIRYEDSN